MSVILEILKKKKAGSFNSAATDKRGRRRKALAATFSAIIY